MGIFGPKELPDITGPDVSKGTVGEQLQSFFRKKWRDSVVRVAHSRTNDRLPRSYESIMAAQEPSVQNGNGETTTPSGPRYDASDVSV